jgi:hypothetical protein
MPTIIKPKINLTEEASPSTVDLTEIGEIAINLWDSGSGNTGFDIYNKYDATTILKAGTINKAGATLDQAVVRYDAGLDSFSGLPLEDVVLNSSTNNVTLISVLAGFEARIIALEIG